MKAQAKAILILQVTMALCAGIPFLPAALARNNMVLGLTYFTGRTGAGSKINGMIARRYAFGCAGLEIGRNAQDIRTMNPAFQWFIYNSATDNYVDTTAASEDAVLAAIAKRHGWNPEIGYLHFYDDTSLRMGGQEVFVPGWTGGTAKVESAARVPIYDANLTRRIVNFSTPQAKQLNKEVFLTLAVDSAFAGTNTYPDGIVLDNCAAEIYNTGEVISGGHILETPDRLEVGSPEFEEWHWNNNLGPFLKALKDTLRTSASWSRDHKKKLLMINVSNVWTDSYVTRDVADILYLEFQYDPVRNSGAEEVRNAWRRDSLAASAGIRTWYSPDKQTSLPGHDGEFTDAEAYLGSLAWYLTTRSDESIMDITSGALPSAAGWDTTSWRGCLDIVKNQLGNSVGGPYVFAQGTDPTGKRYHVWARDYDNGLVLVRNRGDWNEGIEARTAVSVRLRNPLAEVSPEGRVRQVTSGISLRNGEAAILLGSNRQ